MDANAQRMLDLLVTTQKIAEEQQANESLPKSSSNSSSTGTKPTKSQINNGNLSSSPNTLSNSSSSTKKSTSSSSNTNNNTNVPSTPNRNNNKSLNNSSQNNNNNVTPSSSTKSFVRDTNTPSSSSLIPTPGERLIKWGERRDKKIEEERKKLEDEKIKQENCTFQPNLSPTNKFKRPQNTLLERQNEWENKRNQKIEILRKEEEYNEIAEVSSPRITPRAQASAGHLPLDIKAALHNPVPTLPSDPENVLVRQMNDFNAFLLRQQKARLEKERKEIAMARVGTAGGPPPALRFTGKPTIPTEPLLHTNARAEDPNYRITSPRHSSHRFPIPNNNTPLSPNFNYPYGAPYMVPSIPGAPILVPIESLNNNEVPFTNYPSIDPNFQSSYPYPIPTLVPISSLATDGSITSEPSTTETNSLNTSMNSNNNNNQDPAWSRYAPEIAALLKVSNLNTRSGSVVAHVDEEIAKEREMIRNSLEKDSLPPAIANQLENIPELRPTMTNNAGNKVIDASRMSLKDLYSNPLPSFIIPGNDIYMAAVQAAQQSNFQTRT